MASTSVTSVTISAIQDPALRALAQAWNKNGDDTLTRAELPNDSPDTNALFDRMATNAPAAVSITPNVPAPATAPVNGLAAPVVAVRAFGAGMAGYQRASAMTGPTGQPSLAATVEVARAFVPADGVYSCTNAGTAIGAAAGFATGYGIPVGAMAGGGIGSVLDSTEYCPTGKINRIAGDITFLASYVPVDQAVFYTAAAWNGALYYMGYGG